MTSTYKATISSISSTGFDDPWTRGYTTSTNDNGIIANYPDSTTTKIKADDVIVGGKSLSDTLSSIEERLAILQPNKKLEAKWEQLKELGDQYRKLEKELLSQENVWDILNK